VGNVRVNAADFAGVPPLSGAGLILLKTRGRA
jgi:hypothetical protein